MKYHWRDLDDVMQRGVSHICNVSELTFVSVLHVEVHSLLYLYIPTDHLTTMY